MGQAKDRQKKREAKKAKRKLNHKVHVKASNVESNSSKKTKPQVPRGMFRRTPAPGYPSTFTHPQATRTEEVES